VPTTSRRRRCCRTCSRRELIEVGAIDRTRPRAETTAAIRHLRGGHTRDAFTVSVHPGDGHTPDSGRPE
jgi:hypothetical protein